MNKDDILTLYDYNYWANARVLSAAAKVVAANRRYNNRGQPSRREDTRAFSFCLAPRSLHELR